MRQALLHCLRKAVRMWSRISIRYVAASLVIGVVIALNILTYIVEVLKPLTALLDPKTLTIVMGSIPSTLAGIAIAAQLLAQRVADPQNVLLALIVGRALHTIAIEYHRVPKVCPTTLRIFLRTEASS